MRLVPRFSPRHSDESGFTIVELLVYLVIGLIITGSVYELLIRQNRLFMKQREVMDVQGSLKGAATLLAWELREMSGAGGDLYSLGPNSVALRSVQGTGTICGEHDTLLQYGLWGTSGEFHTTANDSALVFSGYGTGEDDDMWKVIRVSAVLTPAGGNVPTCFLGDAAAGKGKGSGSAKGSCGKGGCASPVVPDLVLEVTGDMDGVYVGAPLRAFRRVEYGLYSDAGTWWLGRKVGAAASYEKLMGPLLAPGDSGLVFTYYDRFGNTTVIPTQVASIEIIIRGEGYVYVPGAVVGKGKSKTVTAGRENNALTTLVSLRG